MERDKIRFSLRGGDKIRFSLRGRTFLSVFQSPLWQRRTRRPKKDWHLCKARPLGTPSRIGLREPSFRAVLLKWRSVRHDQMSGLVWMASCTFACEHGDFLSRVLRVIVSAQPHGNSTVDYGLEGGGQVTLYVREFSFFVSVVMCPSALTSLFLGQFREKSQYTVPGASHFAFPCITCHLQRF